MRYRADIDGLRAVAVLAVVLFHAGVRGLQGGYVGVDIFFVISGFVIANGIAREFANGTFSIVSFYDRRMRRILPALVAVVVVSLALFSGMMSAGDRRDFAHSAIAAMFSVSNMFFWKTSSYFDVSSTSRPLLHTWSLGVEEQFYLFIPVLMMLALRRSRSFAVAALTTVAMASLLLSVYLTPRAPSANFYALPTRAWELLVGCILALTAEKLERWKAYAGAMGLMGLAILASSVVLYDEDTAFPGLAALAPTLGAALVIASGGLRETLVSRVLGTRPMVAIGLISYSLYLVHWPIIVYMRFLTLREPGVVEIVASLVLSLVLAVLSWKYVETPFRRPGPAMPRRAVFGGALAATVIVSVASLGLASRWLEPSASPDAYNVAAPAFSAAFRKPCFVEKAESNDWSADACRRTDGARQDALLWGDSFAAHYVTGFKSVGENLDVNILQYTSAGCPPVLSYKSYALPHCWAFNQKALKIVDELHIRKVILSARWDLLRNGRLAELPTTIRALVDRGVAVYVVGVSPLFAFAPHYLAERRAGIGPSGEGSWPIGAEHWQRNDELRKLATASGARFIDVLPQLCPNGMCRYMHNGKLLFMDYGHLSPDGSAAAVRCCFPFMRKTTEAASPPRG